MIKEYLRMSIPKFIDAILWRYMSYDKLKSLLDKNALYFCRADLLGDKYEGSYTNHSIKNRPNFYEGGTKHWIEETVPEMNEAWRLCTYVSCWHCNTAESALMWRAYGDKEKPVAIQTTISALRESILDTTNDFGLGFVNYINYATFDSVNFEANSFIPFFYKQEQYKEEREFRIITDTVPNITLVMKDNNVAPNGLFISINPHLLIHSIIISPDAPKAYRNSVENLLGIHNLSDKIINSSISVTPRF